MDRGTLDRQLQGLGYGPGWWEQRELRDLPTVLHRDEELLALSRGKIARGRWLRRSWLVVVTDRRLVCLSSNRNSGWRQVEVHADQITRTAVRVGPFRSRVLVQAGDRTYRLLLPRADAYGVESALASLRSPVQEGALGIGPTRVVRRLVDHVLALPSAAFSPDLPAVATHVVSTTDARVLDERVQRIESQVEALQEQVAFLEDLLRSRDARRDARLIDRPASE